ncbi:MAG: GDSL-type esterase/lipase family protein [Acidobacteriota bacterium]
MLRTLVVFTLSAVSVFAANEKNYTYLALGDSLAFGYDPTVPVTPKLPSPFDYYGYPEVVADAKNLLKSKKLVNASCPGETTLSFITAYAPDNGCYGTGPQGQPSFRFNIGLRANYAGSQFQFAMQELASNKHINVVTLSLGGNELELLEAHCLATATSPADFQGCVQGLLPAALTNIGNNLAYILLAFRQQAHYDGQIVVVNYYVPNNFELYFNVVATLNGVIANAAVPFGAKVADVFAAFQFASGLAGGDPCLAGLLVRLGPATCDIHPSAYGKQVMASAVAVAIAKK